MAARLLRQQPSVVHEVGEKMPFRKIVEEEKNRVKETYLAEFSLAQIALAVGCSATTVSKFLDKSGPA